MIKDIVGYEGLYKITDKGVVIALEKIVPMPNGGIKTLKKHNAILQTDRKGYLRLWLSKNGTRKNYRVHRLVLEAFIGKSNLQCNHKDQNKKNNDIKNLEWVTNRENTIHRIDKSKTSSQYTGVVHRKDINRYMAQKSIGGKNRYLGMFKTEKEAYNAYCNA